MTQVELKSLRGDEALMVSYKGLREFKLKNLVRKGDKITLAFGWFDSGDGEGVRLHRVLASTLRLATPNPETKGVEMTEEQFLSLVDLLATQADRFGYEVIKR